MPRRYPGAAAGRIPRSSNPAVSAFPGRGRRVGLRIVLFEACSAFTRVAACTLARSPIRDPLIEGFSHFVTLHDCSDCFRLERIAGWGLHPLESAALSRRTPISVVRIPRCWHILIAIQDALREPLREASSAGYLIPRLTRANAVLGRS